MTTKPIQLLSMEIDPILGHSLWYNLWTNSQPKNDTKFCLLIMHTLWPQNSVTAEILQRQCHSNTSKVTNCKLPGLVCGTSGPADVLDLEGMSSVSFGAERKGKRLLLYSSGVMIQCHT